MKKLILLSMILLLALLAESQPFKRITASNPDYRWQQDNTFEKNVTRCNSSGVVTDTLSTMKYVRDNIPNLTELYSFRDSLREVLNDYTTLEIELPKLSYIQLPSKTTGQINALTGMNPGAFLHNSTEDKLTFWNGSSWVLIAIEQ